MNVSGVRLLFRPLLCLGMLLAISTGASAQRWEDIYGGPNCVETGHNGVRRATEGGYIAVGETFSSTATCTSTNSDIYVVRTNNHGALAWSKSYNIGRIDKGTDIEEVLTASGAPDGFVITGYTNHGNSGDNCPQSFDILILRIDRCGNVQWVRTYGGTTNEYGWDILRATRGNGTTTNPGDYIVAGWTGDAPNRNGHIIRVTSAGNIIWGAVYLGSTGTTDDYFYAIDELTANTAFAGQVVAAGGTTRNATLDCWLNRIDATATGAPLANATFGRTVSNEDLRSVQELASGSRARDIVATGQTALTGTGSQPDVYILETDPAFVWVADRIVGTNAVPDAGFYIREVPVSGSATASTVVVTGYLTPPAAITFGAQDAFLQRYQTGPNSLAPVTAAFIYGSTNFDQGWSVEPVFASGTCITNGFIVAGVTQNPAAAPNDPSQLYLFKTNATLGTGCQRSFSPANSQPIFPRILFTPPTTVLQVICTPPIASVDRTWRQEVCPLNADGTVVCAIPDCPPPATKQNLMPGLSDNSGSSGSAVNSYPNPVERGQIVTLECMLQRDDKVAIMVSDMAGIIVHGDIRDVAAGTSQLSLNTEGWSAGAYMIQVRIGRDTHTRRIIVTDR